MKTILSSLVLLASVSLAAAGQVYINEVLPNPPGSDSTASSGNEFFELRGTPNMSLSGYYLLSLEGQGSTGRGDINQFFDLGAFSLGANGYLFARQHGQGPGQPRIGHHRSGNRRVLVEQLLRHVPQHHSQF